MLDCPKILVVEDNDLNRKLFHDLLTIKSFKVIESKEGYDVMDIALRERPSLILMDIQLCGISGIDLIKALKTHDATKYIPIIAVTAFAMQQDELKIMESGCDMYLSKPVMINDFFNAIAKYVNIEVLV